MIILPDLVLETIIRDGLELVRRKPSILEQIFGSLTADNLQMKYGQAEINRIKRWVREDEVAIVQAFSQVNTNLPCVSIQLLAEDEDLGHAVLSDYAAQEIVMFDDDACAVRPPPITESLIATAFDPALNRLTIPDSQDLEPIRPRLILVDTDGNEFEITSPISEIEGDQFITIEFDADTQTAPNISEPFTVQSSINSTLYEINSTREQSRLLLGIHTEERLATIYLFTLIKFFITSRKRDLENNCLELSTYNASDFTRNQEFSEPVFSRFLTFRSMVENEWRDGEAVPQIDWTEIVANVQNNTLVALDQGIDEEDLCVNEHLELTDKTIQITTLDDD